MQMASREFVNMFKPLVVEKCKSKPHQISSGQNDYYPKDKEEYVGKDMKPSFTVGGNVNL